MVDLEVTAADIPVVGASKVTVLGALEVAMVKAVTAVAELEADTEEVATAVVDSVVMEEAVTAVVD